MKLTMKEKVLVLLLDGLRLSELGGLHLGLGTSLRTRISELRADGWDIKDEFVESSTGARYKEYFFTAEFLKHYSELTEIQNEEMEKWN